MSKEPLGSVLDRIEEQRMQKIREIETATEKEIRSMIEQAKKDSMKIREDEVEKAAKRSKADRELKLAHARLINTKNRSIVKREMIEELVERTLDELDGRDRTKRKEFLDSLIQKARTLFAIGVVRCKKEDSDLIQDSGLSVDGTLESRGGLIVIEEGGKRVIDMRYETLVQDALEDCGEEIMRVLFGDL